MSLRVEKGCFSLSILGVDSSKLANKSAKLASRIAPLTSPYSSLEEIILESNSSSLPIGEIFYFCCLIDRVCFKLDY